MTTMLLKVLFFFVADPSHYYSNLSEANRNTKTETKEVLCDSQLRKGWYRFVGAAGTRMPTERVQAFRCGTNWPDWLTTTHPTVEDGEVRGVVCFSDRSASCHNSKTIFVKNADPTVRLEKNPLKNPLKSICKLAVFRAEKRIIYC